MSDVASPNPVSRERQLVSNWLRVPKVSRDVLLQHLRAEADRLDAIGTDRPDGKAYRAAIALLEWERE